MKRQAVFLAPILAFAAAATAAPPLAVPFSRPTPEEEKRMVQEAEETRLRAEAEEAFLLAAGLAPRPDGGEDAAPAETAGPEPAESREPAAFPEVPGVPEIPEATEVPAAPPAPEPPEAPAAPEPPEAPAVPEPASDAVGPSGEPDSGAPGVFRRDPFWPVALSRARKADHDAAVAAAIEEEKRKEAIAKARQDAAAKGLDVADLDDDALADLAAAGNGSPLPSRKPKGSSSFAGAAGEEWDAAEAKIPPRSGYLGGKKPALMLKGTKKPYYVGDEICVTNRNVVFTWRVSKVDFRAYAHELERVAAAPVREE